MVVRAPADGTVVVDGALAGDYVATGTALAVATDLTRVRVTALVDETHVDQVQVGQRVDIAVDAFPAEPLAGVVVDVRPSTADATGPLPASSATGEFQKVTQVVPVRIAIADTHGLALVPGMSATVRILRS
jgi:multidrug resistance efflux pump